MKEIIDQQTLDERLSRHFGSITLTKHWLCPMLWTEGVDDYKNVTKANWLMDKIATEIVPIVKAHAVQFPEDYFFVIHIDNKDGSMKLSVDYETQEEEMKNIYQSLTDTYSFNHEITIWCVWEDSKAILYLPSEH